MDREFRDQLSSFSKNKITFSITNRFDVIVDVLFVVIHSLIDLNFVLFLSQPKAIVLLHDALLNFEVIFILVVFDDGEVFILKVLRQVVLKVVRGFIRNFCFNGTICDLIEREIDFGLISVDKRLQSTFIAVDCEFITK